MVKNIQKLLVIPEHFLSKFSTLLPTTFCIEKFVWVLFCKRFVKILFVNFLSYPFVNISPHQNFVLYGVHELYYT